MKTKFILLLMVILLPFALFAQGEEVTEVMTAATIITALMPIVTWVTTYLFKKFIVNTSGIITIAIAGLISTGLAWAAQLLNQPDLVLWEQIGFGLLAVVLDQIKVQLSANKE